MITKQVMTVLSYDETWLDRLQNGICFREEWWTDILYGTLLLAISGRN